MKKILTLIGISLIILILGVVFINMYESNPKVILSQLLKKGYMETEELQYKVSLLGVLPVAQVSFFDKKLEVYNGQKVYRLIAIAEPLKRYRNFFKGSAVLNSYIDITTSNPIVFKQELNSPGKEAKYKEVVYDQKNKVMTLAGVKREIMPDTQDPLSLINKIRHADFENVKVFEYSINTNQKNYVLSGTVTPQELSLKNNKYRLYVLQGIIKRRGKNNPYHQSHVTMVLLRDKENIPLSVRVFASGMLINVKLTGTK